MTSFKTILIGSVLSACMLPLNGCASDSQTISADADAQTIKSEQKPTGYMKPGAAIQFSHNYDGKTNPGEVESFQVFVKSAVLGDNVKLKVENNDGLQIYNDVRSQKLDVAQDALNGLDQTMDMQVSAQEPGRYYLKFIASTDQDGETMMRAYSIAIQVGDQPYVPELGKGMTAEETPEGEKIITMEAKETIKN